MEQINTLSDMERFVRENAGDKAARYASFSADGGQTMHDNEQAFSRIHLRPSLMHSHAADVTTTVLGQPVSLPIGISPSAFHSVWTPRGEVATAAAAKTVQTVYVQSAAITQPEEDIAASSEGRLHWMLVLVRHGKSHIQECILRAENLGYGAIVLAVDSPTRVGRGEFLLPPHIKTFASIDPELVTASRGTSLTKDVLHPTLAWEDLVWIRSLTNLPIILKGVLTKEDASLAVKYGAAAVWVSNHGGRMLDTVLATVDVLPEIVRAVNGQAEVFIDSGVRNGEDVLKALAHGANFVFLGRPVIWGLTYGGEAGVVKVFDILKQELESAMKQTGCASVPEITQAIVWQKSHIPAACL